MTEEKICDIKYKGFKTEFYITPRVKEYLESKNILPKHLVISSEDNDNYSTFYEVYLFELIDENNDGIPDDKFGKNFKVVYYGIVEEMDIDLDEKGFTDDFEYKKEKLLEDCIGSVTETLKSKSFKIKYKILIN